MKHNVYVLTVSISLYADCMTSGADGPNAICSVNCKIQFVRLNVHTHKYNFTYTHANLFISQFPLMAAGFVAAAAATYYSQMFNLILPKTQNYNRTHTLKLNSLVHARMQAHAHTAETSKSLICLHCPLTFNSFNVEN